MIKKLDVKPLNMVIDINQNTDATAMQIGDKIQIGNIFYQIKAVNGDTAICEDIEEENE